MLSLDLEFNQRIDKGEYFSNADDWRKINLLELEVAMEVDAEKRVGVEGGGFKQPTFLVLVDVISGVSEDLGQQ